MGIFKDVILYSYTKPLNEVRGTFSRVKDAYFSVAKPSKDDVAIRKYEDLYREDQTQYQKRLESFKARVEFSLKFGFFMKVAGAGWGFYNFVLFANAIFSSLPILGHFLSMVSGILVFCVGSFWINSHRDELYEAESRVKKASGGYALNSQDEMRLIKNFTLLKRILLFFLVTDIILLTYYLSSTSVMNVLVCLAFGSVIVSQLFKYSLYIHQISTKNLSSARAYLEEKGYKDLLNPYL